MLTIVTLLAAASLSAPTEPLAGRLRAAIWNDLLLNAMIGNGNWPASLWYNAGQEDAKPPDLHILNMFCLNMFCGGNRERYRCSFTLLRDGGVRTVFNEEAPDRLDCSAQFVRSKEPSEWAVKHRPPRGSGHSRTDMQCKAVSAG